MEASEEEKQRMREYNKNNREKIKERNKKYYIQNGEQIKIRKKQERKDNPEKYRVLDKKNYQKNREVILKRKLDYAKKTHYKAGRKFYNKPENKEINKIRDRTKHHFPLKDKNCEFCGNRTIFNLKFKWGTL